MISSILHPVSPSTLIPWTKQKSTLAFLLSRTILSAVLFLIPRFECFGAHLESAPNASRNSSHNAKGHVIGFTAPFKRTHKREGLVDVLIWIGVNGILRIGDFQVILDQGIMATSNDDTFHSLRRKFRRINLGGKNRGIFLMLAVSQKRGDTMQFPHKKCRMKMTRVS